MARPNNSLPVTCKCGQEWDQSFALPMEMSDWIKRIKNMKCPACGAKGKSLTVSFSPQQCREDG